MPAITLSPAAPNVTLSGYTQAYGTIGSYYINFYPGPPDITEPVAAAIFGTQNTNFNILNSGTILSTGTSQFDAGIVLGGVGAVKNTGTIDAPAGIFILGYRDAGAYVGNFGTIIATKGEGIDVLGVGGVNNSGFISAATAGIFDNGGLVENFGTIIAGEVGLFQRSDHAVNAGLILATGTLATGVVIYGYFTNTSTAAITATGRGILVINYSTAYNDGTIRAAAGIVLTAEASFYNTGIVSASGVGIYQGLNHDPYTHGAAYITNYAGGTIAGKKFGIQNKHSSAYIYNAGLITGATGASDLGIIVNSGTFKAADTGIFLYGGTLINSGKISGGAGIAGQSETHTPFAATIDNSGKILGRNGIRIAGGAIANSGYIKGSVAAGITLTGPGEIYNGFAGTIYGAAAGAALAAGGQLTNTGYIASAGDGVDLASQTYLYNRAVTVPHNGKTKRYDGTISGVRYGVSLAGAGYINNGNNATIAGAAAVYMAGLVSPATTGAVGAYLYNYGAISGARYGVLSRAGTIAVIDYNASKITGQTAILAASAYLDLSDGYVGGGAAGIVLTQGGTIRNSGIIRATGTAISAAGPTSIFDRGQIIGADGIVLAAAGYIYASSVQGFTVGVDLLAGGTVVAGSIYGPDAITISGGGTVIAKTGSEITGDVLFGAGANRLVLDPGAQIRGLYISGGTRGPVTVNLGGGTLELADARGSIGVVAGFETDGASAITIDSRANWAFASYEYFSASARITNDGTIRQTFGAGATIGGAITGRGDIDIRTGTITLNGAVGAGQAIKFSAYAGELALGDPEKFAAAIQNFGPRDTIDLTGLSLSEVQGLTFAAGILTLTETEGDLTFTFSNPGHFANETFSAVALGAGTGLILTPAASANSQNSPGWLVNNPISLVPTANPLITLQT